jgi:hypothetical protein
VCSKGRLLPFWQALLRQQVRAKDKLPKVHQCTKHLDAMNSHFFSLCPRIISSTHAPPARLHCHLHAINTTDATFSTASSLLVLFFQMLRFIARVGQFKALERSLVAL